jgi:hypothetical protein
MLSSFCKSTLCCGASRYAGQRGLEVRLSCPLERTIQPHAGHTQRPQGAGPCEQPAWQAAAGTVLEAAWHFKDTMLSAPSVVLKVLDAVSTLSSSFLCNEAVPSGFM